MILHDWESVPSDVDVCIVGSGPVGLALALKCANQGLSVAILESGEEREATKGGGAPNDDSVTPHHVTPSLAAASGLGGTSRLWSGRCVPLDDIDFEERAFVPFSGWPITRADISVYHAEALEFLGSGAGSPPPSDWIPGGNVSNTVLERWSSEPDLSRLHGQALRTSQDIKVCTSCTATEIKFDDGRRATALIARRRGHVVEVKAKFLVLAAGGLGNTRLLLATQREWPRKFGGPGGPLGGFYTGHLTGYLAKIRFHQQALVPGLWYQKGARGTFTRRRLSISPETQRTQSLLNIGFWLDPISIADPAHCSGALSAIYLGLETLGLYKRLGSGLAPSTIRGKSGAKRQHWANIRGDGEIIPGLLSVVSFRVRQGMATRMRGLVNPTGHYLLRFHAEQAPDPTNCVRLLDDNNDAPLPNVRVNYRFAERDAESVVRSHEVLDRWLRDHNLGLLEYLCPPQERLEHVLEQAVDGYHQIGLTRMGANLRHGVVDANCRVHDTDNLFVAGSSVFPTAGQANPTLSAVALAMRLADHISLRLAQR